MCRHNEVLLNDFGMPVLASPEEEKERASLSSTLEEKAQEPRTQNALDEERNPDKVPAGISSLPTRKKKETKNNKVVLHKNKKTKKKSAIKKKTTKTTERNNWRITVLRIKSATEKKAEEEKKEKKEEDCSVGQGPLIPGSPSSPDTEALSLPIAEWPKEQKPGLLLPIQARSPLVLVAEPAEDFKAGATLILDFESPVTGGELSLFEQALNQEEWGFREAAEESLQLLLRTAPTFAMAWFHLGRLQEERFDFSPAEESYKKAIQCDPSCAVAHCNLGCLFEEKGDLVAAKQSYEASVKIDPSNTAVAFHNLGFILEQEGDTAKAAENYEAALQAFPGYALAHNSLGFLHEQRGDLEAAEESYKKAAGPLCLADKEGRAAGLCNLGRLMHQRGEVKFAEETYEEALRLDPTNTPAKANLELLRQQEAAARDYVLSL